MKKIAHFFLFSSCFIASCAVAQALLTFHLLKSEANPDILLLVGFSTLFTYNVDTLFHRPTDFSAKNELLRDQWVQKNYWILRFLAIISLAPIAYALCNLPSSIFYVLVPLFILALQYTFPLVRLGGNWTPLKQVKGIKAFIIAAVFSTVVVLIPYLFQDNKLALIELLTMLFARFTFIAALAIYFDVRDIGFDQKNGIKSLPVLIGIPKTKRIAFVLILLFLLLISLNPFYQKHSGYLGMFLSGILSLIIFGYHPRSRSEFYYSFFIDGLLIFQLTLVYLFS